MLRQAIAITAINVRSIPQRWTIAAVIVVGLAGVVAVFTALLAMSAGFESTLKSAGRPDIAIVLRGGSGAELNSGFDRESTDLIKQGAGIRRDESGRPLVSAEMTVIAELVRKDSARDTVNVQLRGVEPAAFALRPQVKIVAGRQFTPGLRELIAGSGVVRQFQGAQIGSTVRMRGSQWTVVGIFQSGDANESELWTDLAVARTTFGRSGSSSVRAALDGPGGFDKLKNSLTADPRLSVDVLSEEDYYSNQTKNFRRTIGVLAGVVTIIMGLGAVFAALNSMYAAVATRGKEIATLRALGFGALPVVLSVMVESLLLALGGGVLGAILAYGLFNGMSVSTLGQNFTQVVFDFKVTPALVIEGLIIAVLVGMIGGLLPAVRAARLPVTTGLRES